MSNLLKPMCASSSDALIRLMRQMRLMRLMNQLCLNHRRGQPLVQ